MKTLYEGLIADAVIAEGILGDIDDTIKDADDYIAELEKAEKDWKKLLKNKRCMHTSGDQWSIKIDSPELARFFAKDIYNLETYKYWEDDFKAVAIIFKTSDALFGSTETTLTLQVRGRLTLMAQSHVLYITDKDAIKIENYNKDHSSIPIKDACKILMDIIEHSTLLKDLNKVKTEFVNNITFKRK